MPSFSDSLLLKNIFLALTYQTANFPSTLHDCGYDEVFIEKAFTNSRLEPVHYDLAVCAPSRNYSALMEFKGGQYTRTEEQGRLVQQVQRYSAVTGEDVVQKAGFSVATGLDPRRHTPQSLIVGLDGQMSGVEAAVPQSNPIPLLAARVHASGLTYSGLLRVRGSCTDPQLDGQLDPLAQTYAIPITLHFDQDSKDVDIADAIIPTILQMFYHLPDVSTFSVQDVLERAIIIWPLIDPAEQQAYRSRVRRILSDLASHEFRGWFEWDNTARQWRILQPLGSTAGDRMRTFRRLQRMHHQALGRLGGGQLQQVALPLENDDA